MKSPDGRCIMIGWMQDPKNGNFADARDGLSRPGLLYAVPMDHPDGYVHGPEGSRIFGQMTIPRELSYRNGRLYQWPVRELETLRRDKAEYILDNFNGSISYPDVKGRNIDLQVDIEPVQSSRMYHKFALRLAKDEQYYTTLSFHPSENILKIDRKFSGSRRATIHQRRSKINTRKGRLSLRIILDRYSMEVFVNGGEYVLTATIFTDLRADDIEFLADGDIRMHVVKYDIVSESSDLTDNTENN